MGKEFDEIMGGLEEMKSFLGGEHHSHVRITTRGLKFSSLHEFSPEKIRALRISLAMSQSQFAEALGVKALTVSKWEQGINPPSGSSLRLLQILTKKPHIFEEANIVSFG